MSAQDVILGARVARLGELKAEVARLKAENARLRDENAALAHHFDLALLAAEDLRTLPPDGRLVVLDGWNLVLMKTYFPQDYHCDGFFNAVFEKAREG